MCDRKYLELLRGFLEFDLKVMDPWEPNTNQKKLSKWFHCLSIAHASLLLLVVSFVCFEWNTLSIVLITENISIAREINRKIHLHNFLLKVFLY